MRKALVVLLFLSCVVARADDVFPKPGWVETPNPLASPNAVPGGQIVVWGGQSPKSLNYYLDYNVFSVQVLEMLYDPLLVSDPLVVGVYEPLLAEKWSLSDDKKTFTFWMNPRAKWSDGLPITADDVKWTFDTIMDPKNLTGPFKVLFGRFASAKVIGNNQVQFTASRVHWSNMDTLAGMVVLPKHVFGKKDFNLVNFEFPVVSGAYALKEIKEGIYISFDRRADYWNRNAPSMKGTANFQTVRFKIFNDRDVAYQAFLKGEIDLYPVYTARVWAKETSGKKFDMDWIVKQGVTNHKPVGFQGFAMNMRKPPFDDARVREAMVRLVNREKMNATLMYNQYFLQKSYCGDLYDQAHPCPNTLVPFDKEGARKLLKEAGWRANSNTGLLEKDGVSFSFKFLDREASTQKFLAIYSEDLKDVGVQLIPDMKDGAAWTKDMDEFNYQMTWASWSQTVRKDPEPMWYSKEADRRSGQNLPGLKDAKVDALIEKQRSMFDVKEQEEAVRQIDRLVFQQHPYALLWQAGLTRLLYWNKFGTPPAVLSKYGEESSALSLWWYDEDSAADLEDAMAADRALPKKPSEIDFDKAFQKPETVSAGAAKP